MGEFDRPFAAGLDKLRNPRLFHFDHGGMAMPKGERHGKEEFEFGAALPHFDPRLVQRVATKQRRIGRDLLEIAADGDGFGYDFAVVENEDGYPQQRIDRREFGG